MSTARQPGWAKGALVAVLEGIVAAAPQPIQQPEPKVVTLQPDLKKLVEAIRLARRDLAQAKQKRTDFASAWVDYEMELTGDEDATMQRLIHLQVQFAQVAHECGLEVHVPAAHGRPA
jgi:hypothetical protein